MSIETVNRALGSDRLILLVLQDNDKEDPGPDDVRKVGTVGHHPPDGQGRPSASTSSSKGWRASALDRVTRTGTSMRAQITPLPETYERTLEVDAHVRRIQELIDKALSLASGLVGGAARRSS